MCLAAVTTCVNFEDYLEHTLPRNRPHFDAYFVVTHGADPAIDEICRQHDATVVRTDSFYADAAVFNKGRAINDALDRIAPSAWVLHLDCDIVLPRGFRDAVRAMSLDAQTIYGCVRRQCPTYSAWRRHEVAGIEDYGWDEWPPFEYAPSLEQFLSSPAASHEKIFVPLGFFQLFARSADCLRSRPAYPDSSPTASESDIRFAMKFPKRDLLTSLKVLHLASGAHGENWNGRRSCRFTDVAIPYIVTNSLLRPTVKMAEGRHGAFRSYFANGSVAEEGAFVQGLAQGSWTERYESGAIEVASHYHKGRLHGPWTQWNPGGRKVIERAYRHNRLHGEMTAWHSNGQRAASASYQDGQLEGDVTEWYENGQLAAVVPYRSGQRHGTVRLWYPNGVEASVTRFAKGREHGRFLTRYQNARRQASGGYWHGERHGRYVLWYDNGQKSAQAEFRNGIQHGPSGTWNRLDRSSASLIPRTTSSSLRIVRDVRTEKDASVFRPAGFADLTGPASIPFAAERAIECHPSFSAERGPAADEGFVAILHHAFIGLEGVVFDRTRVFLLDELLSLSFGQLFRTRRGFRYVEETDTARVPALVDIRWPESWPIRNIYHHPAYRRTCKPDSGPIVRKHRKLATIVHKFGGLYYHWVLDSLPRLLMLRPLLDADPEIEVLVDYDFGGSFTNTWTDQYLDLLGIDRARIVRYDPSRIYAADTIYCPGPIRSGRPPRAFLEQIRASLLPSIVASRTIPLVLFAGRSAASYRRVINHTELLDALRRVFEDCEVREVGGQQTVAEQIALFAAARIVIGVHGSDMANAVFCQPGSHVLEIAPEDHVGSTCFEHQCEALGLAHRKFLAGGSGIHDDFHVPVGSFVAFLGSALDAIPALTSS